MNSPASERRGRLIRGDCMSDGKKPNEEIALPGTLGESLRAAQESLAELGKLSRDQFKGFDRIAKLFPEEQLKGITFATRAWHDQFSGLDRMAKLFPEERLTGISAMARAYHDQFSGLGRMAKLFSEERLEGITSATRAWHDQFSGLDSITKRFAEQVKGVNALSEQFAKMDSIAKAYSTSIFANQASAYSRLLDRMRPVVPESFVPALDRKLFDAIAPSATFLGALGENSGLLTNLEGVDDVVGTVSWVAPDDDEAPAVHAAGILDHAPGAGERLDIEVAIKCGLCGELMPVPQRSVEWQSPRKVRINVKVLPVCPRCVHEVQGSPEYWIEKFEELQRPKLKLIRGDGQNPDHAGGDHLRLIEDGEDEE